MLATDPVLVYQRENMTDYDYTPEVSEFLLLELHCTGRQRSRGDHQTALGRPCTENQQELTWILAILHKIIVL